jgi:hypothetical protein
VTVGGCSFRADGETGKQIVLNNKGRTMFGAISRRETGNCLVKTTANGKVYDSFQAIVFKTNGWFMKPQTIDLDDIDSTTAQSYPNGLDPFKDGWKESMAAFGMRNGNVVRPSVTMHQNSLLAADLYYVSAAAMDALGFKGFGTVQVPGGEFGASFAHNCMDPLDSAEANRCRMTVGFEEPVDTVVVMYAQSQLSQIASQLNVGTYLSDITLSC